MCTGQGLAQDLVEGQGCAIASRGLQQDLVPGRGRYTYSGGRGMGCDYNIIVHLEKFSHFPLKMASFNCKFSRNSTEVAKWVIVILCGPRACTRSCARPRAAQDLVPPSKQQCGGRCGGRWGAAPSRLCLLYRARAELLHRHRRLGKTGKSSG